VKPAARIGRMLDEWRPEPASPSLRPFTTRVFNRFSRLFAGRLPGFGLLVYRGRTSGREFRTPMNVFRRGNEYVFALTYGADVQWVRNVIAAGGCQLVTGGRTIH
jgi:hypothetical protein